MRLRRFRAVMAIVLLVAVATAVIGSTPAAGVAEYAPAAAASPVQPHPTVPSCVLSANCGGGGATSGGSVLVAVAVGSPTPSLALPALYGRVGLGELRHLPLGVPTDLLRPPQGSEIQEL